MPLPCPCHAPAMLAPCPSHAPAMLLPCSGHAPAIILPCSRRADNRTWPKTYVGEFAANAPVGGVVRQSLRAAVAEAMFMLGFERNADVVVASSFAPLLNNVHGTQCVHVHVACGVWRVARGMWHAAYSRACT